MGEGNEVGPIKNRVIKIIQKPCYIIFNPWHVPLKNLQVYKIDLKESI